VVLGDPGAAWREIERRGGLFAAFTRDLHVFPADGKPCGPTGRGVGKRRRVDLLFPAT